MLPDKVSQFTTHSSSALEHADGVNDCIWKDEVYVFIDIWRIALLLLDLSEDWGVALLYHIRFPLWAKTIYGELVKNGCVSALELAIAVEYLGRLIPM